MSDDFSGYVVDFRINIKKKTSIFFICFSTLAIS